MLEYNRTLELILGQITLELTAIQMDLNRISLKRDFEQCKNDVLHLADTDVSLLAIYYIEAELEKREKLEWVISKSVSTIEEKESIKQHLKNLYYLVKNDLLNTSQYENERVSVLNFVAELKQSKIDVDIDFDMPKSLGLSSITRTFKQEVAISETKFHRGSLRSGQRLETEGSIVIIGDVNSGAEVIASDNIVVLGNLRGLAHAGAKGNKNAIIAAGKLDAVQLRISNIVKEIDRDEEPVHRQAYVFVEDDKIIIE